MINWTFWGIFAIFSFFASVMACYPLRTYTRWIYASIPCLMALSIAAYLHWGSYFEWQQFEKYQKTQALLQSMGGTKALIQRLKSRLAASPNDAQGWYLLSKLYLIENNTKKAKSALNKAYHLNPKYEK